MKYFELISVFLTIEKTIKKYDLKPNGSAAMPEAHANANKNFG